MKNQRRIFWDIETGAAPHEILHKFYEAMANFDEAKCKKSFAGARKEGKKGEDFIAKKREDHADAKVAHWENYVSRAALDPVTGVIVAIGWRENGVRTILTATNPAEEKLMIQQFLNLVNEVISEGGILEGFNTDSFDLTYVFRRGLKYRLAVLVLRRGRFWAPAFRDILLIWQAGNRKEFISLEHLAEFLGTEHRKNGDGAFFAAIFAVDPSKAIAYLDNDLRMTEEVGLAVTPEVMLPQVHRAEEIVLDPIMVGIAA